MGTVQQQDQILRASSLQRAQIAILTLHLDIWSILLPRLTAQWHQTHQQAQLASTFLFENTWMQISFPQTFLNYLPCQLVEDICKSKMALWTKWNSNLRCYCSTSKIALPHRNCQGKRLIETFNDLSVITLACESGKDGISHLNHLGQVAPSLS